MLSTARHRLTTSIVGATALVLLAGPAWAGLSDPVSPMPAPAVVEQLSPYLPQVSCDPTVKPGTAALRTLLLTTYGGHDLGITRDCASGELSEHLEGRAFDWGLNAYNPADKALAQQFLDWLLAPDATGTVTAYNARRLGVMYVIWNRQIWGSYNPSAGWRAYTGVSPHTDHVHISLSWAGALKATSFWTGQAAPVDYGPCRTYGGMPAPAYSGARLTPCPSTSQVVPVVTPVVVTTPPPSAASGSVLPAPAAVATPVTAPVAVPRVAVPGAAVPRAVAVPAAGPAVVPAAGLAAGLAVGPAAVASAVPATATVTVDILSRYASRTLRIGATGPAVVVLQKALQLTADGAFGPKTAAAVLAFNTAHGLVADSVVRPATWVALGAPATAVAKRPSRRRHWSRRTRH